jgi:hypothetical protein
VVLCARNAFFLLLLDWALEVVSRRSCGAARLSGVDDLSQGQVMARASSKLREAPNGLGELIWLS